MMISVSNIAIFLTTTLFITGITIGDVGTIFSSTSFILEFNSIICSSSLC